MTVSSAARKAGPFLGNGVATVFPFTFKVFKTSDVAVTLTDPNGVDTLLVLDSQYSVTLNADQDNNPGGTITYPRVGSGLDVLPLTYKLTAIGSLPYNQTTDLPNPGPYFAKTIEDTFDRTEIQIQQLTEVDTRTIKVGVSDIPLAPLPGPSSRANQVLGFDAMGNLALLPIPSSLGAGDRVAFTLVDGVDFTAGVSTQITLPRAPGSPGNLELFFDPLFQGFDQWAVNGVVVTFTSAIPVGVTKIFGYVGTTLSTQIPPMGSVGDAQLLWGNILFRVVDSVAALAALDTSRYQRAFATGARSNSDGGGGPYWYDAATPHAGADGFLTVPALNSPGCWKLILQGDVSVAQAGAVDDGVTDNTPFFAAALATTRNVFIPPTTIGYLVKDRMVLDVLGQRVYGAGRLRSTVLVNSTFNLLATGVFRSNANCVEYEDFAILFDQPDTAVKANLTQYPPAIDGLSVGGQRVRRMRISRAWNGLDWRGNAGQSTAEDLLISAFNVAINLDGALDTVRINDLHCWPVDLTTNQTGIMTGVGGLVGVNSGRCDDLKVSGGLMYCATPFNIFDGTGSIPGTLAGPTFGEIAGTDCDGFGGIVISGTGRINVVGGVQTAGSITQPKLVQTGGALCYSGVEFQIGADFPAGPFTACFGQLGADAVLQFVGCQFYKPDDACLVYTGAGKVMFDENTVIHQPNAGFVVPILAASGTGVVKATGNQLSPLGTGTQPFFSCPTDAPHVITGNQLYGHAIGAPIGQGYYAGNIEGVQDADFASNNLVGAVRTARFISTADGAGNVTIAHGIAQLQLTVLRASGFYKGASGEAVPLPVASIDGTNITVGTGGAAGRRVRVTVEYTSTRDIW